jgi:hypothetical protein
MKTVRIMIFERMRTKLGLYTKKTTTIVYDKEFRDVFKENPEDFTRNRKMSFPKLILFMLTRRKGSTQNALEDFFNKTGDDVYMTQQAFSEARNKVKVLAFTCLFYMTVETAYEGYYDTYKGYRILAIDGSKIALPDIELLGQIYGTMGPDCSSPTAQASICYDVLNKVVVDAQIEPLSTDERTLALTHIKNLDKGVRLKKELVIMDRGYPSYEIISELQSTGISFLMRVKKGFNNNIDAQTSPDDYVILQKKGYADIKIRVIKFILPSGEQEVLITNLFNRSMGVKAFKKLYFLRWPIETKYDEVKNKLEIENFTGVSKKAIEQDFYATMYLTNIAAAAWWEAQAIVEKERKGKNNKYKYQVNVNHEIGVLKDRLIYALSLDDRAEAAQEVKNIIGLLAKRVCPVKPERSVNRNNSPRKSKFHSNSRSVC